MAFPSVSFEGLPAVAKPKDAMIVDYGGFHTSDLKVGLYFYMLEDGRSNSSPLGSIIIKPDPSGKNHAEHDVVIDVHGKYAGCFWELVAPISKEHICALWYDGETETPPAHAAAKP